MIIPPAGRRGPLTDAILIARDFFAATGTPKFGPDGVELASLIKATGKYTREVLGENHAIEIHGGNWPKHRFLSMLLRTNQKSIILVHHSLNWCYTPFVMEVMMRPTPHFCGATYSAAKIKFG